VGKLKKEAIEAKGEDRFVFDSIARLIAVHEAEIAHYHAEFRCLCKKHKEIRDLMTIPGIGTIGAVKIAAYVVDARRFKAKGKFHSYCGLVRHDRMSGGRKYGTRKPKYNRTLKQVFDAAAVSIIGAKGSHSLYDYYTYLLKKKHCASHNARKGLSRRVATIALSVMRSGKPYHPRRRKTETQDLG
jgi:transposase